MHRVSMVSSNGDYVCNLTLARKFNNSWIFFSNLFAGPLHEYSWREETIAKGRSVDVYGYAEREFIHNFAEGIIIPSASVSHYKLYSQNSVGHLYFPLGNYSLQGYVDELTNADWQRTKLGGFLINVSDKGRRIRTVKLRYQVRQHFTSDPSNVDRWDVYDITLGLHRIPTKSLAMWAIDYSTIQQNVDLSCTVTYKQYWPTPLRVFSKGKVGYTLKISGKGIYPTASSVGTCAAPSQSDFMKQYPAAAGYVSRLIERTASSGATQQELDLAILDSCDKLATVGCFSLENAKDLTESIETLKKTFEMFKNGLRIKNPMMLLKFLSAVHLWWRYVVKTTAMDLRDLIHFLSEIYEHRQAIADYLHFPLIGHGGVRFDRWIAGVGRSSSTLSCKLSIGYEYSFDLLFSRLQGTGLKVSHFWGLIPFSFVFDWFIPIEKSIDGWELANDLARARILANVLSMKHDVTVNSAIKSQNQDYVFIGRITTYNRTIRGDVKLSTFPVPFKVTNPFRNWATGLALLISTLWNEKR